MISLKSPLTLTGQSEIIPYIVTSEDRSVWNHSLHCDIRLVSLKSPLTLWPQTGQSEITPYLMTSDRSVWNHPLPCDLRLVSLKSPLTLWPQTGQSEITPYLVTSDLSVWNHTLHCDLRLVSLKSPLTLWPQTGQSEITPYLVTSDWSVWNHPLHYDLRLVSLKHLWNHPLHCGHRLVSSLMLDFPPQVAVDHRPGQHYSLPWEWPPPTGHCRPVNTLTSAQTSCPAGSGQAVSSSSGQWTVSDTCSTTGHAVTGCSWLQGKVLKWYPHSQTIVGRSLSGEGGLRVLLHIYYGTLDPWEIITPNNSLGYKNARNSRW